MIESLEEAVTESIDPIDSAFNDRRAAQSVLAERLRLKQQHNDVCQVALEHVRDRVLIPALDVIVEAFERNGATLENSAVIAEDTSRAGGERRFVVAADAQPETLVISAIAVRAAPTSDEFRVSVQVAERREQSEVFAFASLRGDGVTEAVLKDWASESLVSLVVARLRRRGL
jgi:hypothetical protein